MMSIYWLFEIAFRFLDTHDRVIQLLGIQLPGPASHLHTHQIY